MPSKEGLPPCDQLEVVKPNGGKRQAYRIFDHVTVHITVAESNTHSLGLRLELYAKPQPKRRGGNLVDQPKSANVAFKLSTDAEMVEVRRITIGTRSIVAP